MQHELSVRCQLPGHNGAGRAGYEVQEGLRRAVGGDRERVRPAALSVQPDLTEPGYATIAETMTPTASVGPLPMPTLPASSFAWTATTARQVPNRRAFRPETPVWQARPGGAASW